MAEFLEALRGPPLVLGIDPRPELHGPGALKKIYGYSLELMEALAGKLAAVKFQTAFFEAMGPAGFALMHQLFAGARVLSLPVIIDAKRGDVGSTAEAYAKGYLEAYPGSALTVNPYLGGDALEPFFRSAEKSGGLVFVLVKTSNPGSGLFQDFESEGKKLYHRVAEHLASEAEKYRVGQWSRVGAVVGATYPDLVPQIRALMPRSPLLLPGIGAQAAKPVAGLGLLNAASRSLYYPGGKPNVAAAVAEADIYLKSLQTTS